MLNSEFFNKRLLGSALLLWSSSASFSFSQALSTGPSWWSEVDPDYGVSVIDPNIDPASVDHSAPANLGQAKWMAYRAWKTLEGVAPTIAAEVNTDLTGGASPILVNGRTPSNNPEDSISLLNSCGRYGRALLSMERSG